MAEIILEYEVFLGPPCSDKYQSPTCSSKYQSARKQSMSKNCYSNRIMYKKEKKVRHCGQKCRKRRKEKEEGIVLQSKRFLSEEDMSFDEGQQNNVFESEDKKNILQKAKRFFRNGSCRRSSYYSICDGKACKKSLLSGAYDAYCQSKNRCNSFYPIPEDWDEEDNGVLFQSLRQRDELCSNTII